MGKIKIMIVFILCCQSMMAEAKHRQEGFAVKTNAMELVAGIANLGAEWQFSRHFSLNMPVRYSPYTISDNYRLRLLTFQPEMRYWFSEAFSRHFIGIHPIGAFFNISINSKTRYQSDRMAYGCGLSYGYALSLGKSTEWRMEFNIGMGYVNAGYDMYYNIPNGSFYGTGRKDYFGVTQACIGLTYLISGRDRR